MIILRKQVTVAQLILCSLCISCSANSLFIVTGGKKLLMHVQQALPRTIKEIVFHQNNTANERGKFYAEHSLLKGVYRIIKTSGDKNIIRYLIVHASKWTGVKHWHN